MKNRKIILALLLGAAVAFANPISSNAQAGLDIKEESVDINYQGVKNVNISYTGAFSDLAVVVGDPTVCATYLADNGNGSATLSIGAIGYGKTAIAVCKYSNSSVVDYVYVNSGLTTGEKIEHHIEGMRITSVFNEGIIEYGYYLNGLNGAKAQLTGVELEREKGLDKLKFTTNIIAEDSTTKGLSTFNAHFYDVSGKLIKSQEAFVRSNLDLPYCNICWYIPEDCVKIVID